MDQALFILIGLIVGAVVVWFILRGRGEKSGETDGLLLIQNRLETLAKTMDEKLGESNKEMREAVRHQFGESQKLVRDITEKLVRLDETNKQVVSFADQLQNLQDILKNPKQRGILGEYYLETILKNTLPPGNYQMQYAFKDGEIVDAAVFVKDKIIPIDSKFSLENYNRMAEEKNPAERERLEKAFVGDLKMRIQETAKYIRPAEGTLEFAFMFIPHEAIYYDLLVNKIGGDEEGENLIQRAAQKYKVIIISPTSFLAYLQTVLEGLKRLQIEERTKEIIKNVGELTRHLKTYDDYHNRLGKSLGVVVNHYEASSKEFKKIDKDIVRISGAGKGVGFEQVLLDKPAVEE